MGMAWHGMAWEWGGMKPSGRWSRGGELSGAAWEDPSDSPTATHATHATHATVLTEL
jgi:hypothetical protein